MNDCTVCGWELEENAWFCSNCSVPVHRLDAPFERAFPARLVPLVVDTALSGEGPALSVPEPRGGSCPTCGKTLSLVERAAGCRQCARAAEHADDPVRRLVQALRQGGPPPDDAVAACRDWSRLRRRSAFRHICRQWAARGIHDEASVAWLHALMLRLGLDPSEAHFEGRVRLHLYADRVSHGAPLPRLELWEAYGLPVERFPGEVFHYFAPAVHYEPQIRKRRYVRGARPSLPGGRGPLRLEVAGTRGDVLTEKEWVARTSGILLITDRGIRLHTGGPGRLLIPLTDVVSHARTEGRLIIHRTGRGDPYVFLLPADGPSEIVDLCLQGLLGR